VKAEEQNQLMTERENHYKNEYRMVEKERDRLLKDLANIKHAVKMKEGEVKGDMERHWHEWT
jgi:hypothetical protein